MARTTSAAEKLAKNLELIQQLLAKAENTPYPAEAETFMEHAERLMVRYGIDKAQIDAEAGKQGKPREKMVEHKYEVRGVYRVGQVRGLQTVAEAFNTVQLLESTWRGTTYLYLIGAESDVAQIVRLFDSLMVQVVSAMNAWWATVEGKQYMDRPQKEADRRQFQLAFFGTVASRLRKIYGEESTGSELVLADRKDRASEHAKELYPNVRVQKSKPLRGGSYRAAAAGMEAGRSANVQPGANVAAGARQAVSV